jgi:hypothetical protein
MVSLTTLRKACEAHGIEVDRSHTREDLINMLIGMPVTCVFNSDTVPYQTDFIVTEVKRLRKELGNGAKSRDNDSTGPTKPIGQVESVLIKQITPPPRILDGKVLVHVNKSSPPLYLYNHVKKRMYGSKLADRSMQKFFEMLLLNLYEIDQPSVTEPFDRQDYSDGCAWLLSHDGVSCQNPCKRVRCEGGEIPSLKQRCV